MKVKNKVSEGKSEVTQGSVHAAHPVLHPSVPRKGRGGTKRMDQLSNLMLHVWQLKKLAFCEVICKNDSLPK